METRLDQLYAFLEENPADPFLHYAVASELYRLERIQEALERFVRLTSDFPDYLGTYYHLGKLYESLGQVENALHTYEKGISVASHAGNRHALGELRAAWNILSGTDEDEDDY